MAIAQIAISVLLVVFVLLQQKGTGLSLTFGGGMGGGEFYHSRRGIEKVLHYGTIVLAVALVGVSLASVFV